MSETATAEELRIDNDRLRECILAARNVLAPLRNPSRFLDVRTGTYLIATAMTILDSEGGVLPRQEKP